jgi:hypothetical protein
VSGSCEKALSAGRANPICGYTAVTLKSCSSHSLKSTKKFGLSLANLSPAHYSLFLQSYK